MDDNKNKTTYVTQKLDTGKAKPIEVNNTPKIVKSYNTDNISDIYETKETRKYNKKVILFLIISLIIIILIFLIFELPMILNK